MADGHSMQGKCEKENQFVQHTNCIREKALKFFITEHAMKGGDSE
jgi:hypothetical protein